MGETSAISGVVWRAPRLARSTIRVLVVGVLLAAVALKSKAMIAGTGAGPLANMPMFWRFLLVEYELLLACLLLLMGTSWAVWAPVVATFVVFLLANVWTITSGGSDCGCFGTIRLSPWWGLVLDATIIALLIWSRPSRSRERHAADGTHLEVSGRTFARAFDKAVVTAGILATYGLGLWVLSARAVPGRFEVNITPVELGTIPQSDDYPVEVELDNPGHRQLTIVDLETSCWMKGADLPQSPLRLNSGESSKVTLHLRAPDLLLVDPDRLGLHALTCQVWPVVAAGTQSEGEGDLVRGPACNLRVGVWCAVAVRPPWISYIGADALGSKAGPREQSATVYTHPAVAQLEAVVHEEAPLRVELLRQGTSDKRYHLEVIPVGVPPSGVQSYMCRLRARDVAGKILADVAVPVTIEALQLYRFTPDLVLFSKPPSGGPQRIGGCIVSVQGTSFRLASVSCSPSFLAVEREKAESEDGRLPVTIRADAYERAFQGTVGFQVVGADGISHTVTASVCGGD